MSILLRATRTEWNVFFFPRSRSALWISAKIGIKSINVLWAIISRPASNRRYVDFFDNDWCIPSLYCTVILLSSFSLNILRRLSWIILIHAHFLTYQPLQLQKLIFFWAILCYLYCFVFQIDLMKTVVNVSLLSV